MNPMKNDAGTDEPPNTGGRPQGHASLLSILNGMDALICVSDSENNRILFLNDKIRETYGIAGDGVGQLCHSLLQGLDQPCPSCPHLQLLREPDKILVWEHREVKKGKVLHKTARLIDWPGGKKGHLEYALDITELRKTQNELEQREKKLALILRAVIILLSQREDTFEKTIHDALQLFGEMVRLDRMSIWEKSGGDESRAARIFQWDRRRGYVKPDGIAADTPFDRLPPQWEVILESGNPVNGLARDLPGAGKLRQSGCKSLFVNPIFSNNTLWGFALCEDHEREQVFAEDESGVLRTTTLMLADIAMRRREMSLLREANERVEAQAHWYKSILDAMPIPVSITDADKNWVLVNKAVEEMLGTKREDMIGKPCKGWNASICGTEQCGIECVKRGAKRTFFKNNGASYQVDVATLRSLAGETAGFIEMVQDITRVENLARRQGEMEHSITQLETKVLYDQLTGVHSRRYFEERTNQLMASLSRSGGALTLMMIDIDYFKQYNDTYGHVVGDACLKSVAECLQNCLTRQDDFVARYGGEEFVAVLPNTDGRGARVIADRILDAVRNRNIPHGNSSAADRVTISIGVATNKIKHECRLDDCLRRADEMLYKSKQGGRNRCTFDGGTAVSH